MIRYCIVAAVAIVAGCGRDELGNSGENNGVIECSKIAAEAARFSSLTPQAQEMDDFTHNLLTWMPDPLIVKVNDSFLVPDIDQRLVQGPSASRITLKSQKCEVFVVAKSPTVEAQVRGD